MSMRIRSGATAPASSISMLVVDADFAARSVVDAALSPTVSDASSSPTIGQPRI
jgi:hypothetical protein